MPHKLPELAVSDVDEALPQLDTCPFTIQSDSKLLLDFDTGDSPALDLQEGILYQMKRIM